MRILIVLMLVMMASIAIYPVSMGGGGITSISEIETVNTVSTINIVSSVATVNTVNTLNEVMTVLTVNTVSTVATVNEARLYGTYDGVTYFPVRIDGSTHAVNFIDYVHHEIHAGSHYYICSFNILADDASTTFSVVVPDNDKNPHMLFSAEGTGQTEMRIFEGATGISGGITANPFNNDRNSTNTSNLTIHQNPTATDNGTQIFAMSHGFDGVNPARSAQLGTITREAEIILKRNTAYLFVFTSRTANNVVSFCGEWYEHTSKY